MKKSVWIFMLTGFIFCSAFSASAYDRTQLEKDCQQLIETGKRVFKASISASRVLSESLVQNGQPVSGLSISSLEDLKDELVKEDSEKVTLQLNDAMLQNLTVWKPQPYGISADKEKIENNALNRRKQMQGKVNDQKIQPDSLVSEKAADDLTKLRKDRSLMQKVYPNLLKTEEKLASVNSLKVSPVKLLADSEKYKGLCVALSMQLVKKDAVQLRKDFVEVINKPENKNNRWYFNGVIALVSAYPEIMTEPAVQNLKGLLPEISKESREAVKAMNFDFAIALKKNPSARKSFEAKAKADFEKNSRSRSVMTRASSANKSGKGKIETRYFSENWGHMWGDMADHLQGNFDQGTQYGQVAGGLIGVAHNAQGIYAAVGPTATMGANTTTVNLCHTLGNTINDMAMGELGMAPDPYSFVGHYAGGVIGAIGGSIGTAAGWLYGTVESHLAQRGKKVRSVSKRGTKAVAEADEIIPLF